MEQAAGPVRTPCFCPNTPHDNDVYELVDADHLPIEAGIAAATALSTLGEEGNAGAVLIGAFLRHGAIRSWNLVDEEGNRVPVNPQTVGDRLTWTKGGVELSTAALARYVNQTTLAPFGLTGSQKTNEPSSPDGPTEPSTSPTMPSSLSLLEPSESSSPASSDGTP